MVFITNSASNAYVARIGPHMVYWMLAAIIAAVYYQIPADDPELQSAAEFDATIDSKSLPDQNPPPPVPETRESDYYKWLCS